VYVFFIVTEYAACLTISLHKSRLKSTKRNSHHYIILPIHLFKIFTKSILNYPQSRPFHQGERPFSEMNAYLHFPVLI
jgi:hypothetical protein